MRVLSTDQIEVQCDTSVRYESDEELFDEIGVDNLPRHQDPRQSLAAQMGIFGLPITVLIDPDGREIARLRGDADWASDNAKAILTTILDRPS